eukprot:scaffold11428_cov105-Isochrysis_galbana.AAC.7
MGHSGTGERTVSSAAWAWTIAASAPAARPTPRAIEIGSCATCATSHSSGLSIQAATPTRRGGAKAAGIQAARDEAAELAAAAAAAGVAGEAAVAGVAALMVAGSAAAWADAARVYRGGIEAKIEEADLFLRKEAHRLVLPVLVLVPVVAAHLADHDGRTTQLAREEEVRPPNVGHVVRKITLLEIALHIRAGPVRVRRQDEPLLILEADGCRLDAHKVLPPPVAAGAVIVFARRALVDALDEDQPARAMVQHVIPQPARGAVPVRVGIAFTPRGGVRLVLQVNAYHVPLSAELRGELGPIVLDSLLGELFVVPQAISWPRLGAEAVGSDQDEQTVRRGRS